ncbi:putative prefoldin subunit [Leptomonas pyrrhocoris]|uniref:Putative prefoldin subunit n=1 Tax=Leptomonas pyrrhocoris TaxID=157538 RepID=A0A0M9FPE1_LEPPY|nr:putative prefoldin subunit [Leptomonas pyrrhocoris]KPA73370.1 putative prefoldin subunit [Leptomonas pyrrhocoris]|eukprot:XP_015651809.1 putative prefoldin subunit [Leptomonas pyrrhocoris]
MQQVHPDIKKLNDPLRLILKELQDIGEKKGKLIETRRQLGGQKNENELVRDELNRLEPDASVYKLIGPALVPQDQSDAKTIIGNRLDYINGEIKRTDISIADIDRKENELQKKAQELYRKMQERQSQLVQQQQQQQQK